MIILCGIKHCGKSTIGKALGEKLNVPFIDLDRVIEKLAGKSCRELFVKEGKDSFMKYEAEACKITFDDEKNTGAVIATGGGICDNFGAVNILKTEKNLFFIDISEEAAFKRIKQEKEKKGQWPGWIPKDAYGNMDRIREIFHQFYVERTKKYSELCTFDIYIPEGNSFEAVAEILKKIH